MSLKHRKKIYLSVTQELLEFIEEKTNILKITRSKYITGLLSKEHQDYQRNKIDKIIEGAGNI